MDATRGIAVRAEGLSENRHELGVGPKNEIADGTNVGPELTNEPAVGGVPNAELLVVTVRDDQVAVGRKRGAVDRYRLSLPDCPQSHPRSSRQRIAEEIQSIIDL
jgi:hypothetical protein